MSKKANLLVSVLVVALLVTEGVTATVMAQEEPAPLETRGQGLIARVADILGIPQEDLIGALQQARQDMRAEALDRALDKAVEKGLIVEGEALEIKEWLEQRPEALNHLLPGIMRILRGRHCPELLIPSS